MLGTLIMFGALAFLITMLVSFISTLMWYWKKWQIQKNMDAIAQADENEAALLLQMDMMEDAVKNVFGEKENRIHN